MGSSASGGESRRAKVFLRRDESRCEIPGRRRRRMADRIIAQEHFASRPVKFSFG